MNLITFSVAMDLVKSKMKKMNSKMKIEGEEKSLLEIYLSSPEINIKDVIGMSADMLLAGIDTVWIEHKSSSFNLCSDSLKYSFQISYSTSFALYHLATNKEKQIKLYEESLKLLPETQTPVTSDILAKAEYLKSVLKESYRLNPVSVGIGRILSEDAVFSGYRVPKGVGN